MGLLQLSSNVAKYASHIPWFMYDLTNKQLIVSTPVPKQIQDQKNIVLTEVPISGLNYEPVMPSRGQNRKLSFTLMVINRDNAMGNMIMLQQFQLLRNRQPGILSLTPNRVVSSPKVLYYWGVGGPPLEYWVSKCSMAHDSMMTNQMGQPQHTEVEIELILDETSPLYQMEQAAMAVSVVAGPLQSAFNVIRGLVANRSPY